MRTHIELIKFHLSHLRQEMVEVENLGLESTPDLLRYSRHVHTLVRQLRWSQLSGSLWQRLTACIMFKRAQWILGRYLSAVYPEDIELQEQDLEYLEDIHDALDDILISLFSPDTDRETPRRLKRQRKSLEREKRIVARRVYPYQRHGARRGAVLDLARANHYKGMLCTQRPHKKGLSKLWLAMKIKWAQAEVNQCVREVNSLDEEIYGSAVHV